MLTIKTGLVLTAVCGLLVGSPAGADDRNTWLGPKLGLYYPTNKATRDVLGSQWLSVGFGPTSYNLKEGWSSVTDIDLVSRRANGNKFFMALPSYGITKVFLNRENDTVPYVLLTVGPTYFDYSITRAGTYISKKRWGWHGGAELGAVINRRLKIAARYNVVSRVDDFNFDGVSFSVSYQLARF